ncbi:zinc-finger domain-containing protein [Gaertneriomyces semiglobifer]|nr:zinc-finger domain-containing protein [Gaertneriomyces semiglobifer]
MATEKKIIPQAPNRVKTWSQTQNPKSEAMTGPRFEQTDMDLQPNPPSAEELIKQVPVTFVETRTVACDGGGGALGHPKVWLNLDKNEPQSCGYCGLRFQKKHHHH